MNLFNFTFINHNLLRLDFTKNQSIWIVLDADSGKTVTRDKVGRFNKVQHTGIWLGRHNDTNEPIIMHNHYQYGSAYLSTLKEYAQNREVFWKDEVCSNDWKTVISIGLNHVIKGKTYRPISYNCQVYTNTACNNSSHSEDVVKWGGRILTGLALFLLVRS